jgi:glycosyltransferase involved in cell wall biosynthesis
MTLMRAWVERGDEVIFFNSPRHKGESCFEQRHVNQFRPQDDYDVAIAFRTPNYRVASSKARLKVWYSHDQYTSVNFKGFCDHVHKVVGISPFHAEFFYDTYGVDGMIVIDLPVRTYDYADCDTAQKDPDTCIFTSVPTRGLREMLKFWRPIHAIYPEKKVIVTSDFRLWGAEGALNDEYRIAAERLQNVTFLGAVTRKELAKIQMQASYLLYPCTYDELFCYTIAEALVAGCYAITTNQGACKTTNMLGAVNMHQFAPKVGEVFDNDNIDHANIRAKALARFSPDVILKQWDEKVFKDIL